MSNQVMLEKVEVKGTASKESEIGFRFYDDDVNILHFPLGGVPDYDVDLLEMVVKDWKEDIEVDILIDHLITNQKGLEINGNWYDYDDVKHVLTKKKKVDKKK